MLANYTPLDTRGKYQLETTSHASNSSLYSPTTHHCPPRRLKTMAAPLRPMLLRHALAAPSKRGITTSLLPALRARPTQPALRPSLAIQRATFQTTAVRSILPALPQTIKGTVNDAAPVPEPEPAHGSYHWSFERYRPPRAKIDTATGGWRLNPAQSTLDRAGPNNDDPLRSWRRKSVPRRCADCWHHPSHLHGLFVCVAGCILISRIPC